MNLSWQETLVAGAALFFFSFLLWKHRPSLPLPRWSLRWPRSRRPSVAALASQIREARDKARRARSPRERAEALLAAAAAAAHAENGDDAALGLYLRAMRADPTFCDPVKGVSALLRRSRPEVLETVLWRRLSHLTWSGATQPAAQCTLDALASLYRRELPHRARAIALEKLAARP